MRVLAVVLLAVFALAAANETGSEPAKDAAAPPPAVHLDGPLFLAYVALGVMAMVPIYIGAYKSLRSIGPGGEPILEAGEEKPEKIESMTQKDAYMFPVIGSCVLFSLYVAFKFLSKEWVNFILTGYFLFLGVLAVAASFIKPVLMRVLDKGMDKHKYKFSFNFAFWNSAAEPTEIKMSTMDGIAVVAASGFGIWYALEKHWIANNIIGVAFSVEGIEYLALGSYVTGATLLGGLFIYDIFWVFGTEVMVSVAKSFDAPVKLLFPKDLWAEIPKHSMLGLGDIVVPGVFIALLLRYDYYRSKGKHANAATPYFTTTYIAYFVGLLATVVVMHSFQAAQPALLYLVPACVGASFLLAVVRSEVDSLLSYNDSPPETTSTDKAASTQPPAEEVVSASGAAEGEAKKRGGPKRKPTAQ